MKTLCRTSADFDTLSKIQDNVYSNLKLTLYAEKCDWNEFFLRMSQDVLLRKRVRLFLGFFHIFCAINKKKVLNY